MRARPGATPPCRQGLLPTDVPPAPPQAAKAALVALQQHYKERQTDWRRRRYDCEEALKQRAVDTQEASEAILQLQHQVPPPLFHGHNPCARTS